MIPEDAREYPLDKAYWVTEDGRVFSTKWRNPRELAQNIRGPGYLAVMTTEDGKIKGRYVHRMVAETFLERTESESEVHHIDHDKRNNHLSNLKWVSHSENISESLKHYGVRHMGEVSHYK